jgi:fatty acid desaturase
MEQADVQATLTRSRLAPDARLEATWLIGLLALYCLNAYLLANLPAIYAAIGWPLGGCVLWGLWTIGHDSVHGAAARNMRANMWIGVLALTPTLHPWHATREIHYQHHRYLNDASRDTAWNPWTSDLYATQHSMIRALYRAMRRGLWWLGTTLFLRRHLAISTVPTEQRNLHCLNLTLLAVWIGSCYAFTAAIGASFLFVFVVPFLAFSFIFSTVTLLHHSQVEDNEITIPWYVGKTGVMDVCRHTIDYDLPPALQWMLFNSNLHTLHHLAPRVPFHAWPRMRAIVDRAHPGYVRTSAFGRQSLKAILERYHLFDTKLGRIVPFTRVQEPIPCEKPVSLLADRAESAERLPSHSISGGTMSLSSTRIAPHKVLPISSL